MLMLLSLCLFCLSNPGDHTQTRYIMGTWFSLQVPASTELSLVDQCFQIASRLDRLGTTYDPQSPLSLLAAGDQQFFTLPQAQQQELLAYLERALVYQVETNGAFHPATQKRPFPDHTVLLESLNAVKQGRLVPVGWDLGGMLKGTAIDQMVTFLQSNQVPWALVNGGGDLRWYGRAQKIMVRMPGDQEQDAPLFWVSAEQGALATSANDRRFVADDHGNSVGHIQFVVPPLGPAASQVSVFADTAEKADVWATAVFVLGVPPPQTQPDAEAQFQKYGLSVAILAQEKLNFLGVSPRQYFSDNE
ncbi:MAG: FAD:protein FMN transferase [Acidobacteria bacterium]|nr:FAD:protein FMN transferase [Acidobacteriota bacterium]